jgi:hypothetical protein
MTRDDSTNLVLLAEHNLQRLFDLQAKLLKPLTLSGELSKIKRAERLIAGEKATWKEQGEVNLESIRSVRAIQKMRGIFKKQEKMSEQFTAIDHEEWTLENQVCSRRIEFVNMMMTLIEKKHLTDTQTLTHHREKLHFLHQQNESQREKLKILEKLVLEKKHCLHETAVLRDRVRAETVKLEQSSGLIHYPRLLIDFEHKMDERSALTHLIQKLKRRYGDITKETREIKENVTTAMRLSRVGKGPRITSVGRSSRF